MSPCLVIPTLTKLTHQVACSAVLRNHASTAGIDFTAGALAGLTLSGKVADSLLTGSVSALTKALVKLIAAREKVRPAARAIYHFRTGKPLRRFLGLTVPI
jgi:hypothetical protein